MDAGNAAAAAVWSWDVCLYTSEMKERCATNNMMMMNGRELRGLFVNAKRTSRVVCKMQNGGRGLFVKCKNGLDKDEGWTRMKQKRSCREGVVSRSFRSIAEV